MSEGFPNVEPNHVLRAATARTGEALLVVVCPFVDPHTGARYESSWDVRADPDEITCLYCEFLTGGWTDHGCLDTGDRELGVP